MLKSGTCQTTRSYGCRRVHSGLVVSQLGMSLILLVGAALLIRSLMALGSMDLGFRPKNVLAVNIALPAAKYQEDHRRITFFDTLLERLQTLPQVKSVALVSHVDSLASERMLMPVSMPGRSESDQKHYARILDVSANFFETMGIRFLRGQTFTDPRRDQRDVVIDRVLANRFFPDTDPIGKELHQGSGRRIIGVADAMTDFVTPEPSQGLVYIEGTASTGVGIIVVRTDRDPMILAPLIRDQVAHLEKDQVIRGIEPLETTMAHMLAPRRFVMLLLGLFAGIALILATVGMYGLLQYTTSQQTHDVGIHMALGAKRTDVCWMVLRRGLKLALIGIAVGIGGALALTRLLTSLLYGVTPTDPLTVICVAVILGGIALMATYIPARRAAKIDPMEALRYE